MAAVDGFFALVDDHNWSTAPRIPGRMVPHLPAAHGVLDWGFEAAQPVSFPAPDGEPAVRVGFFDPRGRLICASGYMSCSPGESISVPTGR